MVRAAGAARSVQVAQQKKRRGRPRLQARERTQLLLWGGICNILQDRHDDAPVSRAPEGVHLLCELSAYLMHLRARKGPQEVQHAGVAVAGARHSGQKAWPTGDGLGERSQLAVLRVLDRLADDRARIGLGVGQADVPLDHAVELSAPLTRRVFQGALNDVAAPSVDGELRAVRDQRVQQRAVPIRVPLLHQSLQDAAAVAVARCQTDAAPAPVRPSRQLVEDEIRSLRREDLDALLERVVGVRAPDRLPHEAAQLPGERRPLLIAPRLPHRGLEGPAALRAAQRGTPAGLRCAACRLAGGLRCRPGPRGEIQEPGQRAPLLVLGELLEALRRARGLPAPAAQRARPRRRRRGRGRPAPAARHALLLGPHHHWQPHDH
mmetsp:Transcript_14055/g.37165  ORF Transcript_14055/g.37165 Transcript_14055/m.37165 type:complete len:378 (-) Transcript_14055:203-1336(-)